MTHYQITYRKPDSEVQYRTGVRAESEEQAMAKFAERKLGIVVEISPDQSNTRHYHQACGAAHEAIDQAFDLVKAAKDHLKDVPGAETHNQLKGVLSTLDQLVGTMTRNREYYGHKLRQNERPD